MYKSILRPLLFLIQPEKIHHLTVAILRFCGAVPGGRMMLRSMFSHEDRRLEREVLGIRFPNPVGMAAGFDKNGEVFEELSSLGFGFVEIGTVTPKAQPGNPKPRVFRLQKDSALINRMGFNNRGMESMVRRLRRSNRRAVIGCNLGKNTLTPNENAAEDYLKLFRNLYQYVDYFVVNVSCPNVKAVTSLQNKDDITKILDGLFYFRRGQNEYRPILLKISPDLSREQIADMVDVLIDTPLDGIVAGNTSTRRDGLQTDGAILEKIGNGGLSGAPLTERTIETVSYIHSLTAGRYPIIGVGGIMSAADARRILEAGASLVQVYTGLIYNGPSFPKKICKSLLDKPIADKNR